MRKLFVLLALMMLLSGCVTSTSHTSHPREVIRHYDTRGKRIGTSYIHKNENETVIRHYDVWGRRTGTSYIRGE